MTATPLSRLTRGLLLAVLLIAAPAQAQLYAREAPPGSAFVRAYNNTPASNVELRIAGLAQPPMLPYSASDYRYLPPGPSSVDLGGVSKQLLLLPGHYYTVAAASQGLAIYELSGVLNRMKSMVALFNLLPETALGMKTVDGDIPVFTAVAAGTAAQREINPLRLGVRLYAGDAPLTEVPAVTLGAGKVFSLFVGGSPASPVLVWNED